jgi:hypothetical protein
MTFLKTLFTAPVALPWLLLLLACSLMLAFLWLLAWPIALLHVHLAKSWRELVLTTTRVRLAWAWAWIAVSFLLFSYAATLIYINRISSWIAALPYLIATLCGILIAVWMRYRVRSKVTVAQRLVQGGRG